MDEKTFKRIRAAAEAAIGELFEAAWIDGTAKTAMLWLEDIPEDRRGESWRMVAANLRLIMCRAQEAGARAAVIQQQLHDATAETAEAAI